MTTGGGSGLELGSGSGLELGGGSGLELKLGISGDGSIEEGTGTFIVELAESEETGISFETIALEGDS